MLSYPRLLAYAQLMRLPNVFTAFADICLASCITGAIWKQPFAFSLFLLASGCFYLGGMVWNDIFDREADARHRPFRPLPSERVKLRSAIVLGVVFMLGGIATASLISWLYTTSTVYIALVLMSMIFLYNKWLKHSPAGPVAMGSCRFLNVLMGLSLNSEWAFSGVGLQVALIVGGYIVGVTWFARTEETQSSTKPLKLAGLLMLVAGLAVLTFPLQIPNWPIWWGLPYILFLAGMFVARGVITAINNPIPSNVQNAVKRSIFGLVFLDAVLASVFIGPLGLLIVFLLVPAMFLGRKVYST